MAQAAPMEQFKQRQRLGPRVLDLGHMLAPRHRRVVGEMAHRRPASARLEASHEHDRVGLGRRLRGPVISL